MDITRPYDWSGSSVTGILDNRAYLGHTVGLRSTSLSCKNKKLIRRPESEQVIVENTHPALVTQELWDIVQDVRQHKKRIPKQMEEPNIFSGLAFCADCGKPMVLHRASTMKKAEYYFTCYTYGKRGENECSSHRIREDKLCRIVLDDIRRVTAEQFRMLSADYNTQQKGLQEAIPEKAARLERLRASAANVEAFIEKATRFTTIDQLTPELVRLFIQRVEIGERPSKGSRFAQGIKIVYRDIGCMDSPMEPGECPPQHLLPPIPPIEELMKMLA